MERTTYHVTVHLWIDAKSIEDARASAKDHMERGISVNTEDIEVEEWEER